MFTEVEDYIVSLLQGDPRLARLLEGEVHVEASTPYEPVTEELQVWVYEGKTGGLSIEVVQGDPPAGAQSGRTTYAISCRVRRVGDGPGLYKRAQRLRNNVYAILRDNPAKPTDTDEPARAVWGVGQVIGMSGAYPLARAEGTARIRTGMQADLAFEVQWDNEFDVGDDV
jgi:hypothetical protein